MPECEKYLDWISAELDGELSAAETAELCAHLEDCESCRAYRETLRSITRLLAEELPEPPAALAENVMAHVRGVTAPVKPAKKPALRLVRSVKSLSLAAVAVLAIWTGSRFLTPKGADKTAAAPAEAPAAMARAESAAAPAAASGMVRDMSPAENEADAAEDMTPMEPAAEESGEMLLYGVTEAEEAEAAPQLEITGPEGTVYRTDVLLWTALEESGGDPAECPARPADYVLTLHRPDGSETCRLWLEGGELICVPDGTEAGRRVDLSVKEFHRLLSGES